MRNRGAILGFMVGMTVWLLVSAGVILVLGIFYQALEWNIFGSRVEMLLTAAFISCLALAGIGAGICLVLGFHELIRYFSLVCEQIAPRRGVESSPPATYSRVKRRGFAFVLGFGLCMLTLGLVFRQGEYQRREVLYEMEMEQFQLPRTGFLVEVAQKSFHYFVEPVPGLNLTRELPERESSGFGYP